MTSGEWIVVGVCGLRVLSRWRKFSSAHLNEMAKEVETDSAKHTYTPQFDLAGGDPYLKKA